MGYKERVVELVKEYEPELRKMGLYIHSNPELGMEEFKACAVQTEILRNHGFEVEEGFCGIRTAYKASYKGEKDGPKLAFLAEYDALPGLGHGCGHNLIATLGVGSGLVLKEFVDELGGEVCVIGTPAEETAGSKVPMSRMGAFDDMDAVLMAHPAFANLDTLNTIAIAARKVEFFGKPAHAAAAPHAGINALDAMINLFNLINAMRQQCKDDVRIHGIITDGGDAPNIIPAYTAANFYIRANKMSDVEKLIERFTNCAAGAAQGTGCTFKVTASEEDFMDTRSNMTLCNLAVSKVEEFSPYPFMRMNGATIPGSSDLGDVSYRCPAVQLCFKIGDADNPMEQHTEHVVECAASDKAFENTFNFMKGFAMTGIEILSNPQVVAEMKKEFEG